MPRGLGRSPGPGKFQGVAPRGSFRGRSRLTVMRQMPFIAGPLSPASVARGVVAPARVLVPAGLHRLAGSASSGQWLAVVWRLMVLAVTSLSKVMAMVPGL
jgi:hypothetical protein